LLGIIQLAGAASLGEGRLTSWKIGIFQGLVDGTLVSDTSRSCRLGRLLFGAQLAIDDEKRRYVADILDDLDFEDRTCIEEFLTNVVLHQWSKFRDAVMEHSSGREAIDAAWRSIRYLATAWRNHGKYCEHIALTLTLLKIIAAIPDGIFELMCHPGRVDASLTSLSSYNTLRQTERDVMTHAQTLAAVRQHNILLSTYECLRAKANQFGLA
jgi:hypothetical protein